jgi:creatinine amidohydrolase
MTEARMDNVISMATSLDESSRHAKVALLPVGSFEQHGRYLPLATDTLVACAIAREIVDSYPVMLLPPITISCSHEHSAWTGTVSISARTLHQVIADIADSLHESAIDRLVLVNGHGGNYVLANVVQEASVIGPRMALYPTSKAWTRARLAAGMETNAHEDMHAGEFETSVLLHLDPSLIRPGNESADWIQNDRPHFLTTGLVEYTPSGVIGRPSLGTAAKGEAALTSLAQSFADTWESLAVLLTNDD